LLFLHWRVPEADLRGSVHAALEIDIFDGSAWLTIVVFRLATRPRFGPYVPGVSFLTEANLRTYVRYRGRPGITFLAIHTPNRLAARLARVFTPLPYKPRAIRYERTGDGFTLIGDGFGEPPSPFGVQGVLERDERAVETCAIPAWLLERYRAFAVDHCGELREAEITHPPWVFRYVCELVGIAGEEPGWGTRAAQPPDAAHYSTGTDVRFGPFRRAR
jgi:uncharacterized protein YqjF (DUF2071 family)